MKQNIEIHYDLNQLDDVREKISFFLENTVGFLEKSQKNRIILALDEAIANIIQHNFLGGNNTIKLGMSLDTGEDLPATLTGNSNTVNLMFIIEDNGKEFDPTRRDELDLNKQAEQGKERGLGIHLYSTIMDKVFYEPKKTGGNRLVLKKYIKK